MCFKGWLPLTFTLLFIFQSQAISQVYSAEEPYYSAYQEISKLIDAPQGKSFKKAVFLVENAAYEDDIPMSIFESDIQQLVDMIELVKGNSKLIYTDTDSSKIQTFGAIFKVMTDTTYVYHEGKILINEPFTYDFSDVFGHENWANMFVTKLLATKKGNCHSLPYLYKILAEELGETAHLALAPNHIYIKHYSQKTGWYNTELTSASFPIDAWLMASGYIHMDAIRNEVYMDTLSQKESLALTLLDLAQGYERKFGIQDG
jgi:hypothetical protein